MPTSQNSQYPTPHRKLIQFCCLLAITIGAIAWLGMASGYYIFASLGQNLIPMAPSTSLMFIMLGITAYLVLDTAPTLFKIRLAKSIAVVSTLISSSLMLLSLKGIYFDIEHLGISALKEGFSNPVGHMSPVTAISFLILSLVFQIILNRTAINKRYLKAVFWVSILLTALYTMLTLAYLLGTPLFYSEQFIPPAATTSLAFMALGLTLPLFTQPIIWGASSSEINHQITSSYLIAVFIFLAAGVIAAGHFYHRSQQRNFQEQASRQISAIADLKTNELLAWRNERLSDARLFYKNKAFADALNIYLKSKQSASRQEVFSWLGSIKGNTQYDSVFLLDAQARQIASFPYAAVPLSASAKTTSKQTLQSGQIIFSDFYIHELNHRIYLNIQVPIFAPDSNKTPLGILVLRIDPDTFLYPYIKRWPTESASAETLLVRKDGNDALYLNDLRFDPSIALNRRIPLTRTEVPAVKVVLGETGVVEGRDYRGTPVLAALRKVPDSPWFLVARVDSQEIYRPLQVHLWGAIALIVTLLVSAALIIIVIWKQQNVTDVQRIKDRLQCIVNVFQYNSTSIQSLLDFSLNEAIRMTASRYGYIYYYDEATKLFTLNSWSRDVMESCRVRDPQTTYELDKTGIWGEAVRQRKPIMVNDFSAPDPLKKGIPDGHVGLTNFLTIPLFEQGRIVAVVGVANKESAYDDSDILQLSLLMDAVWKVAEHKRFEETLRETNEYLENLFNHANAPIIVWDPHFKITRFNQAFELLTGQSADEVLGKTIDILFPEEQLETSMAHIRKTLSGERWETVEIAIRHKNGSVKTVLWNSATLFAADRITPVATIAQGQDITDRKLYEMELKQKNIELERFIYTVSHDLKSPLVTITAFLGYLEADMANGDVERVNKDLGFIRTAANKMGLMLSELLELTRIGRVSANPEIVTLQHVMQEAMAMVAGHISERGVMINTVESSLVFYGDRPRLVEIWQNLLENAVKYMGKQPAPLIELGVEQVTGETVFFVKDNGIGIERKYQHKIFGLFDKLDAKSEGSGLGLALVKRIVEMFNGRIWVESEGAGHGSCFRFTLPDAIVPISEPAKQTEVSHDS